MKVQFIRQHYRIVNHSMCIPSMRVYTELLKSYSHLITEPGVALILSGDMVQTANFPVVPA